MNICVGKVEKQERRSCVSPCVLTSIHVHPSIHQSLGHPLCVHLTRNLQGADKKDHLSLEDKVSLGKMSRKINSSSSFSSPCSCSLTLSPPSHQLDSWLFVHFPMEAGSACAGMREDEEEARLHRGLSCFPTALHFGFGWFISGAHTSRLR